jgi:hypothetical protein
VESICISRAVRDTMQLVVILVVNIYYFATVSFVRCSVAASVQHILGMYTNKSPNWPVGFQTRARMTMSNLEIA